MKVAKWIGVAALAGLPAAYFFALRPKFRGWGATPEERKRPLLGDARIIKPKLALTYAVTIDAPRDVVWQWLAQIGQGRAGFYSYTWIENAIGADIHNADTIIPDYPHLAVGDEIPLAKDGFGIPIVAVEAPRLLLLHGDMESSRQDEDEKRSLVSMSATWGFYLYEIDAKTTRLITRIRSDWYPNVIANLDARLLWEPGIFVMQRKMLLGIKERAEGKRPVPKTAPFDFELAHNLDYDAN